MRRKMVTVGLCIAMGIGFQPREANPECWEDEVVVQVVDARHYDELQGTLGCVAADDLPVHGWRPGDDVNELANS